MVGEAKVMVVRYISHRTAFFVEALLAFLLVIALVFAVTGFLKAKNAQVSVNSVEAARIADQRAKVRADYAICVAGIPNLKRINRFLLELKSDYLERAATSLTLSQFDPVGSPEEAVRLEQARRLKIRAKNVPVFPVRTVEQCRDTRDAALKARGGVGTNGQ